jgi:hypothetical protein
MKTTRLFPSFVIAAALSVIFFTAARADEAETSSIKFSNPAQPGTLKVTITNGDIRIHGADAPEVTVRTELKPEGRAQRSDGLRVLTSSASYSLTEKDNVINLSYGADSWPTGGNGDFDITVPRNTSVVVSSAFGGDISVGDISGDLEVKSLNGEVKLTDVSGGALVETMNGEIQADVVALKDGKPLSFTSMNGEVALHLPPDIKANVRLRTHNGSILTDFDEKQLVTKTAALKGSSGHRAPHAMSESESDDVRATVREAVRAGMDAAREAARGAQDAMREANHASHRNDDRNDDEVATPAVPTPPMPPLPPMTGGKIVTGTLNGGGPEIRVTTMNGNVTLRKSEASK